MGVYLTQESMINEMAYEIVKNQTIMKYLVYDDILSDPILKADILNTQDYIYKVTTAEKEDYRIYPLPKVPNITEEKKTMILCWADIESSDGVFFKDYSIHFDVISHIDIWTIAGGIVRPLRIMDEINDIFAQKTTENSIGKLVPLTPSKARPYDSRGLFMGYRISFRGTDFTKSLCKGGS